MTEFPATRTAALEKLNAFVPRAGADYARLRNFDHGAGRHENVSGLSPYIRNRLLTEHEVLQAVLARHSVRGAEKFIAEVYWRTYWKGWLEMRPSVWLDYRAGVMRSWDRVQVESGLRKRWETACHGRTGIDAFDHWAQELVQTGYLHNHARMWFASIWVFTLRLPWQLGADFFLRYLLDGDPASNTLGWRWVAGLQTRGKTYLARPANIAKYTGGRFHPQGLASAAPAPDSAPHPAPLPAPGSDRAAFNTPTALVLHEDDLSPGYLLDRGLQPVATALVQASAARSPLNVSENVHRFTAGALQDVQARWSGRLGPITMIGDATALRAWAADTGAAQIVTPHAPVGPVAEMLDALQIDQPVHRILRDHDARAWPHATHGFFRFKQAIPDLLAAAGLTKT
ncbi:DNA photolyase [Lutimaribacter sp. EGI FJ00015]|uniref:DNA photolyase n=1 Tax=Lutimaribacter degradans TaxID=2945989 RepID=A0ACC5ZSY2_9RHOB|nr:FAD-binding domain-containing protein [Lutimaribacter sp. EGI FJ00013]MCM2560886.1 DNA photolyase [Lutimaribacter sp. EGI FJ00013]MCO0612169.1 DNA photolyase [Lutimaribacter sp. EGI FJ00015]MCO0634711.1 DNA photolyase [Lutimaribacter sp. EGI FJ00014]